MKYKIVSDSASNVFHLSDVDYRCVPLKIITTNREYVDTEDLDLPGMIDDLKRTSGPSSTSCPNVHEWTEAFGDADSIFAVTITSNLSGSCSAALQAKADHPGKIHVVDSLSAGPEMQLILEKLREDILADLSFEEICSRIHTYMQHTHLLFSLESLTNLARNGRVSSAVAKIAGVLGLRLVGRASDHGTLEPLHKCRGEKKALETIFNLMKADGFRGGKVRIAHCFNENAAVQLKQAILTAFPSSQVELLPCTALCSFYAEKGGLMIGYEDDGLYA